MLGVGTYLAMLSNLLADSSELGKLNWREITSLVCIAILVSKRPTEGPITSGLHQRLLAKLKLKKVALDV